MLLTLSVQPCGSGSKVSCEKMEFSVSNEGQRIRQLADVEGFVHPPRKKTAKANLAEGKTSPVGVKNRYDTLCSETP